MRQYYSRDKKRREDAKRKRKEEKRLRRLNKKSTADSSTKGVESEPVIGETGTNTPSREAEE